jgi:hypothetical protein
VSEAQFWLTLTGIVVAIVVPIGLAIHAAGRARSTANQKRLDDHITEDVRAHERIARLETKMDRVEEEVAGLRQRYHNFRSDVMKDVWDLVQRLKADLVTMFRRERD